MKELGGLLCRKEDGRSQRLREMFPEDEEQEEVLMMLAYDQEGLIVSYKNK